MEVNDTNAFYHCMRARRRGDARSAAGRRNTTHESTRPDAVNAHARLDVADRLRASDTLIPMVGHV